MKTLKRLYVLRHGHAEPYSNSQDAQRKLTGKGVAQVVSTAEAFVKKAEHLDVVFVSPYLRAQQTAKTFLATLGESVEVKDCPEITPDGRVVNVAAWLGEQPYESILLITHQPFAYQLIDFLADEPLPKGFMMNTATLAALEGELLAGACCRCRWSISAS
ncbi:MAG: phosphohistidine phosphatase SixA [Marinomonas sp.]